MENSREAPQKSKVELPYHHPAIPLLGTHFSAIHKPSNTRLLRPVHVRGHTSSSQTYILLAGLANTWVSPSFIPGLPQSLSGVTLSTSQSQHHTLLHLLHLLSTANAHLGAVACYSLRDTCSTCPLRPSTPWTHRLTRGSSLCNCCSCDLCPQVFHTSHSFLPSRFS
jgi:hypothetical protein